MRRCVAAGHSVLGQPLCSPVGRVAAWAIRVCSLWRASQDGGQPSKRPAFWIVRVRVFQRMAGCIEPRPWPV